jgi:3-deoxy-manno-octulosonate cytidylyltransferase (CMP-KDO synthetase)
MKQISVLGVIPSRYASTRLPGKPLASILGKPMVQWVYEAVKKALPNVVVATDDMRVVAAVEKFGGRALLTPKSCKSGTDRMAYVAKKIKADFYVNIQGDEPMIHPSTIRDTVRLSVKRNDVATAATTLRPEDRNNPSAVKVILGAHQQGIYFSRTMIPYTAHGVTTSMAPLKHLGLYVYPRAHLQQFVKWPASPLEKTEKLEQLRALYNGMPIFVAHTRFDSIGVDTPTDLKNVTKILKRKST